MTRSAKLVKMLLTVPTGRFTSLLLIVFAYFSWGVLRALNDLLVTAHQVARPGHDAEAMIVHSTFFAAYILMPIPMARLSRRIGLGNALAIATALMAAGGVVCATGLRLGQWPLSLASLFGVAAGIATLQTAGNLSATLLGSPETAAARLLAVQSTMSVGSALASFTGSARQRTADPAALLGSVGSVYLAAAALLALVAFGFLWRSRDEPTFIRAVEDDADAPRRMRASLLFAFLAAFLFVGTEATVLTHVLQYRRTFTSGTVVWTSTVAPYWLLIMTGRLASSRIVRRHNLVLVLRLSAVTGALLVLLAVMLRNDLGIVALLLLGLSNATIFPLLFTLTTESLSRREVTYAAGWMTTAISGGAVLPMFSGALADRAGLRAAFVLPILAYVWIAATASRCRNRPAERAIITAV